MSPDELKAARERIGLSAERFAALGEDLCGARIAESGRTVRRWESGERAIPGPVQVLVRLMLASRPVRKMLGIAERQDA
jgi:DNA-binding transcriptional regulator YiaG